MKIPSLKYREVENTVKYKKYTCIHNTKSNHEIMLSKPVCGFSVVSKHSGWPENIP